VKPEESYGKVTVKLHESYSKPGVKSEESQGKVEVKPGLIFEDVDLTKRESEIYQWFLSKGAEGFFSPKQIMDEMKTSKPTVLKAVKRFQELNYISVSRYSRRTKTSKYRIDLNKKVRLEMFEERKVTVKPEESQRKVEVKLEAIQGKAPIIKEREKDSLLKDLSIFLISDFWLGQGLTEKKVADWMTEFNLDEDAMKMQLEFGENEEKVKEAKSPINYFYTALKKGGVARPKGYELPEERRQRIQIETMKARQKVLENAEKIQQQEKELAEREFVLALLKDKEMINEAIVEIESGKYITPKLKMGIKHFKETGQVAEVLENRLRMHFRSDKSKDCK
ncbi:MAG: hypothetical protein HQK65_15615, partial [Desulfamplus sp.]|nr:hypothetical protein [Desulfamplus sp.]